MHLTLVFEVFLDLLLLQYHVGIIYTAYVSILKFSNRSTLPIMAVHACVSSFGEQCICVCLSFREIKRRIETRSVKFWGSSPSMSTQQHIQPEKREDERKSEQGSEPIHHDHCVGIQTSIEQIVSKDGKEEDVKANDDGSGDAGLKCPSVVQQADHFRCICEEEPWDDQCVGLRLGLWFMHVYILCVCFRYMSLKNFLYRYI